MGRGEGGWAEGEYCHIKSWWLYKVSFKKGATHHNSIIFSIVWTPACSYSELCVCMKPSFDDTLLNFFLLYYTFNTCCHDDSNVFGRFEGMAKTAR